MPTAKMGDKLPIDSKGDFINLKKKDESARVRFINPNFNYDGIHLTTNENGKWVASECTKTNSDLDCDSCNKYKEIMSEMKNITDENTKKEIRDRANKFKVKINFYYIVIDRLDGKAKVLQATLSTRIKLDERVAGGEDIMKYDYILKRTEKVGSDYYSLERVDSADTEPLNEKELLEVEKANSWDLSDMVGGKKSEHPLEPSEQIDASDFEA